MASISAMAAWLAARFGLLSLVSGGGVVKGLVDLATAIVNFFSTTFGRWVGVALIGLALFTWGDVRRGRIERAACQAKIERLIAEGKAAQDERDASIRREVGRDAAARLLALQKLNDELNRKAESYATEIQKRPDAACRATPRDVDRLRRL